MTSIPPPPAPPPLREEAEGIWPSLVAMFAPILRFARLRSRLLDERKFYMGPRG